MIDQEQDTKDASKPAAKPVQHRPSQHRPMQHWLTLLLILLLAGLAYANSLGGAFIYDDVKQIVGNHLIQESGQLGEALTSDVWAFKGDRKETWSNYWRPTFVLWLTANAKLFGVANPLGWHVALVLLHGLVCCLAFLLLRRLGIRFGLSLVAAGAFALHPVHVESVAWISGVPDPLMSFFFLASLLLAVPWEGRPSGLAMVGSLCLFAFALGAKEVAVVLPAILFLLRWRKTTLRGPGESLPRAAISCLPHAILVGVFLLLRWSVLGQTQIETPWRMSFWEALLTVPSLVAFYLRQCFFPLWLGPSYPLRAVAPDALGVGNFFFPVLLLLVLAAFGFWFVRAAARNGEQPERQQTECQQTERQQAKRGRGLLVGSALFALPLLPALNINAFIEEQLVHDRYLYLPLLGLLLAVVSLWPSRGGQLPLWAKSAIALVFVLLGVQTVSYNRAWTSELGLWQRGVESDPNSAFNLSQLGYALLGEGRRAEALEAFDAALEIAPVTAALLARGKIARESGRLKEAEEDFRLVLRYQSDNPLPYEGLALVYQKAGELDRAETVLTQGRLRIPEHRCSFASNLGVVRYLAGRKGEALQSLRSVPPLVEEDRSPACRLGLFHLGNLYRELGDQQKAKETHDRFVALTSLSRDPRVVQARERILARG